MKKLNSKFTTKSWLGSTESIEKSKIVLLSTPMDTTCSGRAGTRFAPSYLRIESHGIESFSPYQNKDIEDIKFFDTGDLELPFGNRDKSLSIIQTAVEECLNLNKRVFTVGGEHLVSYPVIKEHAKKYPNLAVVQFDAHADLRDDFMGEELSHATVMKRVVDIVGKDNLLQIGIRSGTAEEFGFMRKNNTLIKDKEKLNRFKNQPLYITFDVDALDPSIMSGTGTPEAGGLGFNDVIDWLIYLKGFNVVGCDVVELSPHYDHSGSSTLTAAKLIRELLIMLAANA